MLTVILSTRFLNSLLSFSDPHLSKAYSSKASGFLLPQVKSAIPSKSSRLPEQQTHFSIWANVIPEVI